MCIKNVSTLQSRAVWPRMHNSPQAIIHSLVWLSHVLFLNISCFVIQMHQFSNFGLLRLLLNPYELQSVLYLMLEYSKTKI